MICFTVRYQRKEVGVAVFETRPVSHPIRCCSHNRPPTGLSVLVMLKSLCRYKDRVAVENWFVHKSATVSVTKIRDNDSQSRTQIKFLHTNGENNNNKKTDRQLNYASRSIRIPKWGAMLFLRVTNKSDLQHFPILLPKQMSLFCTSERVVIWKKSENPDQFLQNHYRTHTHINIAYHCFNPSREKYHTVSMAVFLLLFYWFNDRIIHTVFSCFLAKKKHKNEEKNWSTIQV